MDSERGRVTFSLKRMSPFAVASTKEGRVLSTANFTKLMQSYKMLGEVLASATKEPTVPAPAPPTETPAPEGEPMKKLKASLASLTPEELRASIVSAIGAKAS